MEYYRYSYVGVKFGSVREDDIEELERGSSPDDGERTEGSLQGGKNYGWERGRDEDIWSYLEVDL